MCDAICILAALDVTIGRAKSNPCHCSVLAGWDSSASGGKALGNDVASVTVGGSCYGLEWFGPLPGQTIEGKWWFLGSRATTVAGEQNAFAAPRLGGVLGMHGLLHAWSLGLWLRCSGLRSRAGFAGPA